MNPQLVGKSQLMARCTYDPKTKKAKLENFSKYYPEITKIGLFK